jgi:hypothetical protein
MVALALRARTPAEAQRHRRATERARDEGPRQTEFDARGLLFLLVTERSSDSAVRACPSPGAVEFESKGT